MCSSFSRAVCPAVRSSERPEGLENVSAAMKEKIKVGNAMASWLAGFVDAALALHMVVWIENPAGSFLWLLSSWKKVIAKHNLQCFYTDYCAWGAPWRKRTRFYGNFAAAGIATSLLVLQETHSTQRIQPTTRCLLDESG